MDDTDTTDSCPLDGRRTSNEVWIKILIAHFTTIVAFCHLLSIRNEKILGIRLTFFFISPLIFVVNHALAILLVIGYGLYWRLRPAPNRSKLGKRALRILCGRIPLALRASQSYELLPTSDPGEGILGGKLQSKQMGRIAVALAFLVQCIGSVVFYRRRQNQDAVTTADTLMVELAYGGILISGLTLATLVRFSLFGEDVPVIEDEEASSLDTAMQHLRELVSPNPGSLRRMVIWQVLVSGISLWTWLLLSKEVDLVGSWQAMLSLFTPAESTDVYPHYMMGLVGLVGIFVLVSQVALFAGNALLALCFNKIRGQGSGTGQPSATTWPSDTGDTVICFFSFFFISAVMWKPTQFAEIRTELQMFAQWPTNTSCPGGVWNDPATSWAWLLA